MEAQLTFFRDRREDLLNRLEEKSDEKGFAPLSRLFITHQN